MEAWMEGKTMSNRPLPAGVEEIGSLGGVVRWATACMPPAEIVDVIEQDEYTRDVIVRVWAGLYLVFDST